MPRSAWSSAAAAAARAWASPQVITARRPPPLVVLEEQRESEDLLLGGGVHLPGGAGEGLEGRILDAAGEVLGWIVAEEVIDRHPVQLGQAL